MFVLIGIKKVLFLLFALAFWLAPEISFAAAPAVSRVAVIPFFNQSSDKSIIIAKEELKNLGDLANDELADDGTFDPMDRAFIKETLESIKFETTSGIFDMSTVASLGKKLGAEYLLVGTITGLTRDRGNLIAHISVRMIHVETSRIALTGRGDAVTTKNVSETLRDATIDAMTGKRGMITRMHKKR